MKYLIWSEEHGAWWAKARRGYTRKVAEAGRYDEAEAERIVNDANKYGARFSEIAFPDPFETGRIVI